MKPKTIKEALKTFGLTEKESELYIFLGKKGPLKISMITNQLKNNRGQVYRTLKKLEKKGLVKVTLEFPARYSSIPFENVIDSLISSKKKEVYEIETAKENLLTAWKKIGQREVESSLEHFGIVEGKNKIYAKIFKLIQDANNQLLMSLSVSDLCDAERLCFFEILKKHPLKSDKSFKLLTNTKTQDLTAIKILKEKLDPEIDFRTYDPRMGSTRFSRMVIRDNEEIVSFISNNERAPLKQNDEVCLTTNCRSIIEAFSGVFENLWNDSVNIPDMIDELEKGIPPPRTRVFTDILQAKEFFNTVLASAKENILITTSPEGLIGLAKNTSQLEEWLSRKIKLRIMAPIVTNNLDAVKRLIKYGEVRHIPLGYFETLIADKIHLFRFEYRDEKSEFWDDMNFQNMFYTNDLLNIKKTTELINDLWNKTRTVSLQSARSLIEPNALSQLNEKSVHSTLDNTKLVIDKKYAQAEKLSEKSVLTKIAKEKKLVKNQNTKWFETIRIFGIRAFAMIHLPEHFDLPKMVIGILKNSGKSTFGSANVLMLMAWLKTPKGFKYVPVTIVQDSNDLESIASKRANLKGTPASENILVFDNNELNIHVKGKTLFAGWTKPIPLGSLNKSLPPCCVMFEPYGEVKPGMFTSFFPSGRKHEVWYLTYDSFVSFFHPEEKYVGSGTDAFFDIDALQIMYPVDSKNMGEN